MMQRFPDNQYAPQNLAAGGPLTTAFDGLKGLLLQCFPESKFKYRIVQPRMSIATWRQIAQAAPMIGMSWSSWHPSADQGVHFRGDAVFALFLLVKQSAPEDLLKGTQTMPGAMGMGNVATQCLHGKKLAGGTVAVRSVSNLEACGWIDDRVAIVTMSVAVKNLGYSPDQLTAEMTDFQSVNGGWSFELDTVSNGASDA
ncbi:hypothetical protein KBX73_10055 [Acetobacter persici]|uniref:hypothetical protein n=1 Tax=Acetobacter persici TaxID=1076596 RepID=UPI0020CD680F|nr:hypothetical protein [Acetobacter persici]MCP9320107.1 hypothetical protein [Acetobacter persici]